VETGVTPAHGVQHCVGLLFLLYPLRYIGLHLHSIQGDPFKPVPRKQKMFLYFTEHKT